MPRRLAHLFCVAAHIMAPTVRMGLAAGRRRRCSDRFINPLDRSESLPAVELIIPVRGVRFGAVHSLRACRRTVRD